MARLNCVTVLAPAKLNLALDVVGLLPSGYHDLDMTCLLYTSRWASIWSSSRATPPRPSSAP